MQEDFKPHIVAFLCTWWAYAAADLAGVSRFQYPPTIRVVRLMCTGSLDTAFIFEAFEKGADGVFVSGCKLGECHYSTGNYHAREKVHMVWEMMKKAGFDHERLGLAWISSAEGEKFATAIREFSEVIRAKGPSPLRPSLEEVAS